MPDLHLERINQPKAMPSRILYVCEVHTQNEVNVLLGGYDSDV